ncbi:MAG: hypothetical protein ABSH01_03510 [Terriglobia bacterium]
MLDAFSASLQNTQFINQATLANALNLLQGSETLDVSNSLSVNASFLPKTTPSSPSAGSSPSGSGPGSSTSPSSASGQGSPASTILTPPSQFGENASDLLADQVNLTYQIFNLRMLLERSITDRLIGKNTRLQAVVGFNVTLDPPKEAEDSAAIVEVTITAEKESEPPVSLAVSLVAVMPQEKTYNSAALNSHSNAFGGSAVARMITVSGSRFRRTQHFYLFRDNDTMAFERMTGAHSNPPPGNELTFGWQFRPVLGRRSVSPGTRQMFAIIALPKSDKPGVECIQKLKVTVKTYWKHFDHGTLTTSYHERWAHYISPERLANVPLGLPGPWDRTYPSIEVPTTAMVQDNLSPEIDEVHWEPVGSKSALISVKGNNFFTGTQVMMGDKAYASTADGLILKSNQAFDLLTSLEALANGPGAIVGRYGLAVPLVWGVKDKHPMDGGIQIESLTLGPAESGNHSLSIHLQRFHCQALGLNDLPKDKTSQQTITPIVTFNGNVVPLPYIFSEGEVSFGCGKGLREVVLESAVADSFLASGNGIAKVSWPFLPERWTAVKRVYDPASDYHVARIGTDKIFISVTTPWGFGPGYDWNPSFYLTDEDKCWKLFAGGDHLICLTTGTCKEKVQEVTPISDYAVAVKIPEGADKVVLVAPIGTAFPLDVPKAASGDSTGSKTIALNCYDAVWVDVAVKDASKVDLKSVEANGLKLKARMPFSDKPGKPNEPSTKIQVEVTRDLTAKPGSIDVTMLDTDGKLLPGGRLQISCPDFNVDGGKQ